MYDIQAEDIIKQMRFQNQDYVDIEDSDSNETRTPFLNVIRSRTEKQLSLFMKFISGSNRSRPGFSIEILVLISESGAKLPTAATCFRTLYLGRDYPSEEDLRRKLVYAIENCNEIAETYYTYNLDADFGL